MPLKVELKPHERVIVGRSIITNGEHRSRFVLEGDEPVLRGADILRLADVDSLAKEIYMQLQLLYFEDPRARDITQYMILTQRYIERYTDSSEILRKINQAIGCGNYYRAIKSAKALLLHEQLHQTKSREAGS